MFEAIAAAIAELEEVDPDTLNAAALSDAIVELDRHITRLRAQTARLTSNWEQRGCWQAGGAKSAAAWLRWQEHIPMREARTKIRLARAFRDVPAAFSVWADGDISDSHVDVLASARTPVTAGAFDHGGEELLLDCARTLPFSGFTKAVAYWLQNADPDGVEDKAARQHRSRSLHMSQSVFGMWFTNATHDPISGAIIHNVLEHIEHDLYQQDQQSGNDRTPAQRRADALVEMAVRAATPHNKGQRPAPLFTVLVGYENAYQRMCELLDGTVVTPGSLVPWLTGASIERVVFESPSRVIDVGVQRRLYEGATRKAVKVRDETCYHPTCDEPRSSCQVDHITEHHLGGPTTQTNGRLACGHHNRQRNHHGPEPP